MTGEIKDIEYFLSKSVSFDWKFDTSGTAWNVSSKSFHLKEISTACLLSMKSTRQTYNTYDHINLVEMRITFANFHLMLKNIDLTIIDVVTGKKFLFHLRKNDLQPNVFSNVKTIHSEDGLFSQTSHHWKITVVYGIIPRHENKIENDFKELFENEKHADFTIKTQNVAFKVHKAILSCRCNVLAKVVESDMTEKQNSELQLNTWDPATMKQFLLFLYTGSCDLSLNTHHLFELANYYQLDDLKLECTRYLQENMNLKNIIETLELVDEEQYDLRDLKTFAHEFIEKNETSLAKEVDFQEYLTKSIKMNNLLFILRLAYTHNLTYPLERAKEFIKLNFDKVMKNEEFKKYLSSQGELLLDILKYTIDSTLQIDLVSNMNIAFIHKFCKEFSKIFLYTLVMLIFDQETIAYLVSIQFLTHGIQT